MKLTRLTIREYAESLAVAFVLAMIIRHFVVEAFRIPTSSMEPTLIGSPTHGDRILVSKFQFNLRPPEQWDVVVFKIDQRRIDYYRYGDRPSNVTRLENGIIEHPGSPDYVNYVKRLIGLPGRKLQIRNGDVFVDDRISRKPEHAQDVLLVPVTNDELRAGRDFFESWDRSSQDRVSASEGGIALAAAPDAECSLTYHYPIEDRSETGSRKDTRVLCNIVGDLKLAFRFRHRSGGGHIVGRLGKNGLDYVFHLPMGSWQSEAARLFYAGNEVARARTTFVPTGEHLAEFSNIDARAVLKVDGEVLIAYDNDAPGESVADRVPYFTSQKSRAEFGAAGCDIVVRDVRLWRDIYYTSGDPRDPPPFGVLRPIQLADDEYFMLGDNSPNSFDSRNWGVVKKSALLGEAFFVFWPIPRWKFIN